GGRRDQPGDPGQRHPPRHRHRRSGAGDERQSRLRRPGVHSGRPRQAGGGTRPHRRPADRPRSRWRRHPRQCPRTRRRGGQRARRRYRRVRRQRPEDLWQPHRRAAPGRHHEARMIPRYSRPEMVAIWSPETRFRIWFEIEAHATDALAELGVVPKEAARIIWEKGNAATFDVGRIDEIERTTRHDVIAFLTHLAEIVGPEARFVHQGMTSSDVLDTCLSVQLRRASDLLIADVDRLLETLEARAREHKYTITIGRSHGIHAEPTTFGVKLAEAYAEFSRQRARLVAARDEISVAAISGAIGTFANIDPRVEAHVAEQLGLAVEPVSTQVIPRDRHAMFFATLGVVASSIERLATEIRHL